MRLIPISPFVSPIACCLKGTAGLTEGPSGLTEGGLVGLPGVLREF